MARTFTYTNIYYSIMERVSSVWVWISKKNKSRERCRDRETISACQKRVERRMCEDVVQVTKNGFVHVELGWGMYKNVCGREREREKNGRTTT